MYHIIHICQVPATRPGPRPMVASRFRHSSKRRPFLDPSGPGPVGGAKNVLQQLTWEWGLGEAERAERVGETGQYCTEHGVGGVLITNRPYAAPGMAAGLSLSYC